jgi:pimeloyl-ACP methyl ester carboxylesterase
MDEAAPNDGNWTKFVYGASDGLQLAGRKYGWHSIGADAVVCLAGLTRNSADFHDFAVRLSSDNTHPLRVLCLDYRGRGMSQHDRNWRNYNVLVEADDVIAGVTAAGIERAVFVGTSRGGLIIFAMAALRPGLLRAAVFNDIGPRIEPTGLVRIRNYLEHTNNFETIEEAAATFRAASKSQFPDWDLQKWIRQAEAILEQRGSKLHWRYDRKVTRSLTDINLDKPLPQMWPQFAGMREIPVMVVRGENSDMLSAETVERMGKVHKKLRVLTVPRQGHAPDLGTREVADKVARFIDTLSGGRTVSGAAGKANSRRPAKGKGRIARARRSPVT